MQLPKEAWNNPFLFVGAVLEKARGCFLGCKLRSWSAVVLNCCGVSLTLDGLPHLEHVAEVFARLSRQSRAVKYDGLMRRVRHLEKQVNA